MFDLAYEIIEALQGAMQNPWMLLFIGTWVLGYMLKEHTPLENDLIPWALFVWGGILGFVLIERSLGAVIVGVFIGAAQIAMYEAFKPFKRFAGGE